MSAGIPRHGPAEVAQARQAARRAAAVLHMLTPYVRAGVSTEDLDAICHAYIVDELRAVPANVGYRGYPKTVCASVNHVVCHGIPSPQVVLAEGDIVNIDVAVIHEGWYGDTSRMYAVGSISPLAQRLVDATYEALCQGIRQVRPGATLGDVGHAIQRVAQREHFSVVREYGGHGIGRVYHGEPHVHHVGRPGQGLRLQEGMIFTIEPMLNAGRREVRELKDGWTVITQDRSLSAQWEHMVAVTAEGAEVLTAWPDGAGVGW